MTPNETTEIDNGEEEVGRGRRGRRGEAGESVSGDACKQCWEGDFKNVISNLIQEYKYKSNVT